MTYTFAFSQLAQLFTKISLILFLKTCVSVAAEGHSLALHKIGASPNSQSNLADEFHTQYFTDKMMYDFESLVYSNLPARSPGSSETKDEENKEPGHLGSTPAEPNYKLYYNNDGYEDYGSSRETDVQGAGLGENNHPIGYNIYLPYGDIKAVVTQVYGGGNPELQDCRNCTMYKRNNLSEEDKILLRQGIAVAKLNLADLLEYDLNQGRFPERVYSIIQSSIHKFFDAIKTHPSGLHADLNRLSGKPIYLMGRSFGGGVVVRHSQLYPQTFDGYISIAGVGGWTFRYGEEHMKANMQPDQVAKISKPILLVHNFDDNRVSFEEALSFHKEVVKQNKQDLVRLWVNQQGGRKQGTESENDLKGHFPPSDPEAFKQMMQAILQFIAQPSDAITPLHMWRSEWYGNYHQAARREKPYMEELLSNIYLAYKELSTAQRLAFKDDLVKLMNGALLDANAHNWHSFTDQVVMTMLFKHKPGYWIVRDHWDALMQGDDSADSYMSKMLGLYLKQFTIYLKDRYPNQDIDKYPLDVIAQDQRIQQIAKDKMLQGNQIILKLYAQANPEVVKRMVESNIFKEGLAGYQTRESKSEDGLTDEYEFLIDYAYGNAESVVIKNLQERLLEKINTESKLLKDVFKKASKQEIEKQAKPAAALAAAAIAPIYVIGNTPAELKAMQATLRALNDQANEVRKLAGSFNAGSAQEAKLTSIADHIQKESNNVEIAIMFFRDLAFDAAHARRGATDAKYQEDVMARMADIQHFAAAAVAPVHVIGNAPALGQAMLAIGAELNRQVAELRRLAAFFPHGSRQEIELTSMADHIRNESQQITNF